MRFKSIEIKNYRPYINVKFKFPIRYNNTNSSDLHVILAENGVGKTSILNAITWCLYGKEYYIGHEATLPMLNLQVLNDAKRQNIKTEIISVKINAENNGKDYIFEREVPFKIDSEFLQKDTFKVFYSKPSGEVECCTDDEAKDYVQKYMPEEIRQYFYFDNEQLHNYFFGAQSEGDKIKNSIKNISQVNIISRISERLDVILKEMQREAGNFVPKIQEINDQIDSLKILINEKEDLIKELEKSILYSDEKIQEYNDKINGYEYLNELDTRRDNLKNKLKDLNQKAIDLNEKAFTFAREMKIAFSFYQACKLTLNIIKEKEKNNELPPNIDKDLLIKALKNNKCSICQKELNDADRNIINLLLEKITISSDASNLLMQTKGTLELYIKKVESYKSQRDALINTLKQNDSEKNTTSQELQQLENKLSSLPNPEEIRFAIADRVKQEALRDENLKKIGAYREDLNLKYKNYEKLQTDLDSALKEQEDLTQLTRQIKLAKDTQKVTIDVEEAIMKEIKEKIEHRATEIYKELLWKENTYDKIQLDNNYKLGLFHSEGYSCLGSCSAAEKALLALSFTLALQEISGYNNLLLIDTPVARTSGEHRKNFAKVLNNVSRHKQIITMFTNDEYSDEIRAIFEKEATMIPLKTNERETVKE